MSKNFCAVLGLVPAAAVHIISVLSILFFMLSRLQTDQHRQRRRAVFGTPVLTNDSSDEEEEGDEEEGQDSDQLAERQKSGSSAEPSGQDDSEAGSDDSEGEPSNILVTVPSHLC